MPGPVPGIHVLFPFLDDEDVDGRDKPGHDGEDVCEKHHRFSSVLALAIADASILNTD